MSEPEESSTGSSAAPFLGALAIIVTVVIAVWLFNVLSSDELNDDQLVARAVSGQNAALQRLDYPGFRDHTCTAERGDETEVLARQRDSAESRGNRIVDGVAGVQVDGDTATAEVTYYFQNDPDATDTVRVRLVREGGVWKVCSTGPR